MTAEVKSDAGQVIGRVVCERRTSFFGETVATYTARDANGLTFGRFRTLAGAIAAVHAAADA